MRKIAEAATARELESLINEFFYSKNWVIENGQAYNPILNKKAGSVKFKNNKHIFYI